MIFSYVLSGLFRFFFWIFLIVNGFYWILTGIYSLLKASMVPPSVHAFFSSSYMLWFGHYRWFILGCLIFLSFVVLVMGKPKKPTRRR
jgi:hypothetical protein